MTRVSTCRCPKVADARMTGERTENNGAPIHQLPVIPPGDDDLMTGRAGVLQNLVVPHSDGVRHTGKHAWFRRPPGEEIDDFER